MMPLFGGAVLDLALSEGGPFGVGRYKRYRPVPLDEGGEVGAGRSPFSPSDSRTNRDKCLTRHRDDGCKDEEDIEESCKDKESLLERLWQMMIVKRKFGRTMKEAAAEIYDKDFTRSSSDSDDPFTRFERDVLHSTSASDVKGATYLAAHRDRLQYDFESLRPTVGEVWPLVIRGREMKSVCQGKVYRPRHVRHSMQHTTVHTQDGKCKVYRLVST